MTAQARLADIIDKGSGASVLLDGKSCAFLLLLLDICSSSFQLTSSMKSVRRSLTFKRTYSCVDQADLAAHGDRRRRNLQWTCPNVTRMRRTLNRPRLIRYAKLLTFAHIWPYKEYASSYALSCFRRRRYIAWHPPTTTRCISIRLLRKWRVSSQRTLVSTNTALGSDECATCLCLHAPAWPCPEKFIPCA